jgi:hypothetical protein
MKALWTKFAIEVCTPPAVSDRKTQRSAHRKEDESETINDDGIGRKRQHGEYRNHQRNESVH